MRTHRRLLPADARMHLAPALQVIQDARVVHARSSARAQPGRAASGRTAPGRRSASSARASAGEHRPQVSSATVDALASCSARISASGEARLQGRLAAGEGHPAAGFLEIGAVFEQLLRQSVHRRIPARAVPSRRPGRLPRTSPQAVQTRAVALNAVRSCASGHAAGRLRGRCRSRCSGSPATAPAGCGEMLSGLWHQAQRSGQPLKKTVVRMPGPSSVERRCRCRMVPVTGVSRCSHRSSHLVAFAGDDLVLQFLADGW